MYLPSKRWLPDCSLFESRCEMGKTMVVHKDKYQKRGGKETLKGN